MSSTPTSVAEALSQAHGALLEDLRQLEDATHSPSDAGSDRLRRRLEATRAHVVDHFRLEEQHGYLDVVRNREPRLERIIEELFQEHRQLAQAIDAFIAGAGSGNDPDEAFREDVRAWVARLRRHESRENELVQDAFNLDISAED